MKYTEIPTEGYERVVKAEGPDFLSFVAVHSTKLGVAMGGTRYMEFSSEEQQLADTLMLSASMTLKHSLANTGMGGGKATIAKTNNPDVWKHFGEFMNYINKDGAIHLCAGDIGTGEKLSDIAKHTDFIAGHTCPEPSGVATGYGVYQSLLGCYDFTGSSIADAHIYVNGYGKVGGSFAKFAAPHTKQTIAFQDPAVAISDKFGKVSNHMNFNDLIENCTVFAPCAMAHVVTPQVVDALSSNSMVVSGANNPEQSLDVCRLAHAKGILFPPAWVSNAGGIIVIAESITDPAATHASPRVKEKLDAIRKLTCDILTESKKKNATPMAVAITMAKETLGY